jgi:uncharacterized protein
MKIIIEKLGEEEILKRGILDWPIWSKAPSVFDWHYSDREQCLFLEGKVTVKTKSETVEIGEGDFVTFPQGLDCVWEITEAVRKHYRFG